MSGILRVTSGALQGYLDKIVTLTGANGKLNVYTSPMPAVGGDSIGAATLLGTVTLASTLGTVAWNSGASAYQLTFNTSTPDLIADADGNAYWARITTSGGTWIADLDITATGGGGYITMPSVAVYAGGTITLSSAVISLPV